MSIGSTHPHPYHTRPPSTVRPLPQTPAPAYQCQARGRGHDMIGPGGPPVNQMYPPAPGHTLRPLNNRQSRAFFSCVCTSMLVSAFAPAGLGLGWAGLACCCCRQIELVAEREVPPNTSRAWGRVGIHNVTLFRERKKRKRPMASHPAHPIPAHPSQPSLVQFSSAQTQNQA